MKVLHFVHALSGGGAEKQLRYLVSSGTDQDLHIAFCDDRGAMCEYPSSVNFHRLSSKRNYSPSLLYQILRLILVIKPDVVQTWTLKFDILVGIVRFVVNFDWVIRESGSYEAKSNGFKDSARLYFGSRASAVVSNSVGGNRYWSERARIRRRVIIHNGYDLGQLAAFSTDREAIHRKSLVLFVGRLVASKNADILVRAMADDSVPASVHLDIVGDGPQKGVIDELVQGLALRDRVTLAGYLPHSQVLLRLASASVLVLPSQFEGTPNVVLEAMAIGVPVVLSDCTSHREFFSDNVVTFFSLSSERPDVELARAVSSVRGGSADYKIESAKCFSRAWGMDAMAAAYRSLSLSLKGVA